MASPDQELRDFFVTQLTLVSGEDAFTGQEIPASTSSGAGDEKDKALFCRLAAGPILYRTMSAAGVTGRDATVQVLVRGNRDEPAETRDFARSAWDAAEGATIAGFIQVLCREAEPTPFPNDENGRPRWIFNVEMLHE